MAAAQTTTPAQNTAPTVQARVDPQLTSSPVTVNTGSYRGPLSMLLAALARSAGYEVVFNFNVDALALIDGTLTTNSSTTTTSTNNDSNTKTVSTTGSGNYASATGRPQELSAKPIAYNFVNKPFNEVWPLLMDVYELQYTVVRVGNGQVLRIGQRPAQLAVPLSNINAQYAYQRALEFFGERTYTETPIRDPNTGAVIDKVRQFDGYTLAGTLKIVPDTENNRLIVGGTAEDTAKVRSFVSTIDIPKAQAAAVPQSQVIYTAKGNPADVVNFLKSRYPNLSLAQYGSSSQIIVSGIKNDVDAALTLLAEIDRSPSIANIQTIQRVYTVKGQQADISALLAAQYPDLKVTPVGQTGQLILSGPQNQLDTALTLLGQVDRPAPAPQAGPQTVQRVFQLVNASAEEVKATLEGTLARDLTPPALVPNATVIDPTTGQPYTTGPLANAPLNASTPAASTPASGTAGSTPGNGTPTSNTATIIADKRTNTLIVRGTTEQVAQIAELIPQLDQVVPQINVQVRIQEINETAARTLGMDWKVSFGGFNVSVGGGGLGAAFDPTRSLVGFNIFPTLQALENQGLTKRVYDGNITMQSGQRSLGSNTATQNASSTAAASIKSGGRLEINIPSQAANVPPIQKQIDYGVNLDFFDPQVAPDGTVTLRVRGQVNQPDTLPTTGLPTLLNFSNSEAQSSITFKSGQTVLMSGLLGTNETRTTAGVPFLSSLPVIGAAFSKQTTTRTQTQLLVIITGTVVK
ncbi:secretin [Deinococcus metallilatus]|uniref:Secretin n=1 Tax=Deinococcus metallilatus TaxID=1211322 RepID=A0AAJ5JYQ9_9DEIO|nr:secretin [Deinococcus metallilatus]RXJ09572.1 secretin [Deinococcus metallilatus]TLK29092.1 secretin [Deinococcus metallilatus]